MAASSTSGGSTSTHAWNEPLPPPQKPRQVRVRARFFSRRSLTTTVSQSEAISIPFASAGRVPGGHVLDVPGQVMQFRILVDLLGPYGEAQFLLQPGDHAQRD